MTNIVYYCQQCHSACLPRQWNDKAGQCLRCAPRRRRNKFNAQSTKIDGFIFDSIGESKLYSDLKLREKAGEINDLKVHPVYELWLNDVFICKYEGDFEYFDVAKEQRKTVDYKGSDVTKTAIYKIKKRLMLALMGIEIVEVMG